MALGHGHSLEDLDRAVVEPVGDPVDEQQLLFDPQREVARRARS